MKKFKPNNKIKESFNKIFKQKNLLNKENKSILNKISKEIYNEDYSSFKAYNKIYDYNLFDEEYYLEQCEIKPEIDSLIHYIYQGYLYGYNPCKIFNTQFYREFNENVQDKNPLVYFVNYGINEGKIKINETIWQPLAINKYEKIEDLNNFNENGLNKNKREIPLIISLTSYPKRINEVMYTIHSLLNQELKADKIILWLTSSEFPNGENDLPEQLLKFKENGLTIKWCESKKSYKKLIPTLKEYPNALIVTADDDLYYPSDWLKKLYEYHLIYPNEIVTHRSRRIRFKDNNVRNYLEWFVSKNEEDASFLNFFTTGGGTLFIPNSLSDIIFKIDIYERICPNSDDIWFWAMAVLNNTKIRVVSDNISDITYINPARDIIFNKDTLWSYNEKHNDEQFQSLLNEFPEVFDKIYNEFYNENSK